MFRVFIVLVASSLAISCNSRKGTVGTSELFADPQQLNFGTVFVGHPKALTFTVRSGSRTGAAVTLTAPAGLVVTPQTATVEAGGMTEFHAVWNPTTEAALTGVIFVTSPEQTLAISVLGGSKHPPDCTTASACSRSSFNPATGTCEVTLLTDGTSCTLDNACFTGGSCLQGACLGTAVDCSDHDACTTDACDPLSGCVHLETRCPASLDPCQAAFCDPATGCSSAPVADGTACGVNDCTTARICLAGACKTVTPPEGSVCQAGSPCQAPGVCVAQSCSSPAKTPLREVFSRPLGGHTLADGTLRQLVDLQGNLFWVEYPASPTAQGNPECALTSVTRDGALRFKTPLNCTTRLSQLLLTGPRVVVENEGRLHFVSAGSGLVEGTLSLQNLAPTWKPGTRWLKTISVLADSAGQLRVLYRDTAAQPGAAKDAPGLCDTCPPTETTGTVMLIINPVTKLATRVVPLPDGLVGAVLDAQDNVYLGFTGPKQVLSLSPVGLERWRTPLISSAQTVPLGVHNGLLLLADGRLLSTLTGQTGRTGAGPEPTGPSAVLGSDYQSWVGLGTPQLGFFKGGTPWGYANVKIGDLFNSELALADDDVVLVAGADYFWDGAPRPNRGNFPGAYPPTTWTLRAVDSRGVTRWSCPLPGTAPDNSADEYRLSSVNLSAGRWTVQQNTVCYGCGFLGATTLRSFDLGQVKASEHGWVGTGGNPGRTGQPRP